MVENDAHARDIVSKIIVYKIRMLRLASNKIADVAGKSASMGT